jgi:quercetin dioxygenase-like cupin family protein
VKACDAHAADNRRTEHVAALTTAVIGRFLSARVVHLTFARRTDMRTNAVRRLVLPVIMLIVGIGIGVAIGQQVPPQESKGVDFKVLTTVDLGPDIPGLQLRAREISFGPGAVAGLHSHKDRPAVAYIKEGTLTELREGGYVKEYRPGDVITESRDVVHWAENKSGAKVTLIGVDIVKP